MYKADMRIDESQLTQDRKPEHEAGVKPRPIRKKGFHRALKRKECWATERQIVQELGRAINLKMFGSETHMTYQGPIGLSYYLEPRYIKIPK